MFRRSDREAAAAFFVVVFGVASPAWAVTDVAVTFEVENRNDSTVPCVAEGGPWTISGRLVAPDTTPAGVTLALHGLGFGEWFWSLPDADFASGLAADGHAVVTIDRLGYGGSGKPNGFLTCLGAQATIARQIAGQLRTGTYSRSDGGQPVAFSKVALAGHSAGGATAQVAAYSFPGDFDALAVLAYADQGASDLALSAFGGVAVQCAAGGTGPDGDAPFGGYARFGETDEDFEALMFHDADPGLVAAASAMRNPDPCGDDASIVAEIVASNLLLGSVTVPVLVLCAGEDAIFPQAACEQQAGHFSGASGVTQTTVPGIGHALTLENEAPAARAAFSAWLTATGF